MLALANTLRIVATGAVSALLVANVACSGSGGFELPPGTPDCLTVCELAWPCGAVLENDLEACIATCNDRDDEAYRACVHLNACEVMADCKLYAPTPEPPAAE